MWNSKYLMYRVYTLIRHFALEHSLVLGLLRHYQL